METIKIILICMGVVLFGVSVFFTSELERYQRIDRATTKIVEYNWPRLCLAYVVVALIIYFIMDTMF